MTDNYKKVKEEGGQSAFANDPDVGINSKKDDEFKKAKPAEPVGRHGAEETSKDEGQKCCCLSIKTGYWLYGLIDLIIVIGLCVVISSDVVKVKSAKKFFVILLVSYLPNVLVWILMLCRDTARMRKTYTYSLNLKLFVAAFVLPLVCIKMVAHG